MNSIFRPAIALMNSLRFPAKMLAMAVVALALIGFLLAQILLTLRADTNADAQKRSGLEYVRPLYVLMLATQQHRGLANSLLNGDATAREALMRKQAEIDAAWAKLDAVGQNNEALLDHAASTTELKREWQSLKTELEKLDAKTSFARHSMLVAEFSRVLRTSAERSQLLLDPRFETFMLSDLIINHLPPLIESAARLRGRATGIEAKKSAAPGDLIDVAALQAENKLFFSRIQAVLGNLAREATFDVAPLKQAAADLDRALQSAQQAIQSNVTAQTFGIPAQELFSIASAPVDQAAAFSKLATDTYDSALERHALSLQRGVAITVGFSVLATLVLAWLGIGAYLALSAGLRRVQDGISSFAGGDLSQKIATDSNDEIGDIASGANRMAEALAGLIRELQSNSHGISRGAEVLASATAQIDQSSRAQSEAASSVAAAVEQMTVSVSHVADSAGMVDQLSAQSRSSTDQGVDSAAMIGQDIAHVETAMNDLTASVDQFVSSAQNISAMTQQIKEIAAQTNLLALNAAIEAARAGEQGRGFAVVADEVRKLAEKSGAAASEIEAITLNLSDRSSEVESALSRGRELLGGTRLHLDEVASGFGCAREIVAQTARGMSDISSSVHEQKTVAHDIARKIESIAQMSEESSSAVASLAAEARSLRGLAGQLDSAATRFRV